MVNKDMNIYHKLPFFNELFLMNTKKPLINNPPSKQKILNQRANLVTN